MFERDMCTDCFDAVEFPINEEITSAFVPWTAKLLRWKVRMHVARIKDELCRVRNRREQTLAAIRVSKMAVQTARRRMDESAAEIAHMRKMKHHIEEEKRLTQAELDSVHLELKDMDQAETKDRLMNLILKACKNG